MTRTFSKYAVFVVLIAAATLALWGARNTMLAQEGNAATTSPRRSHSDDPNRLGRALLDYAEEHGKFPPAARYSADGKPLLSWRVLILPYLGEEAKKLYAQFHLDEPWDSPANKPLLEKMPDIFAPHGEISAASPVTLWQVFAGEKTIFADSVGTPFSDIHDGLSNTILLVEADMAVPWTMPRDLSFDSLLPGTHRGLDVPHGFRVVMADGTLQHVPAYFPITKLKQLLTRKSSERVDVGAMAQFQNPYAPREGGNRRIAPARTLGDTVNNLGQAEPTSPPRAMGNPTSVSRSSLEQQVRQEFDARQESLRQQIKDFSQRLDRLRVLVDERDRHKDAIIQRRVDELRNPNLRWEAADQAADGANRRQAPTVNLVESPTRQSRTFLARHIKAETLLSALAPALKQSKSYIQVDRTIEGNSLTVNAAPEDMEAIHAAIQRLDVPPAADDGGSTAEPTEQSSNRREEPVNDQASELDGLWEINYPQEIADKTAIESRTRVVFYKNLYGTFTGNMLRTAGTFSIAQGTSPKRIAIYGDKPMRGIYEVKDDGLRLNMASIDAAFPTAFGTEKPEFKRINKAVPQELLDRITSDLQDRQFNTFSGNRLSESAGDAVGDGLKITPEREAENAVERALLETINAGFDDYPLNKALDSISRATKVNIVIDELALRSEGVALDHPVTIKPNQPIPLKSLLNQILSPLRLTYVVEGDVLVITTEKGKGSPASVPADAPAKPSGSDPVDALMRRSPNDFQADLAWARWEVTRTRKAFDQRLAEIRKTKPDADQQDVIEVDEGKSDAWEGAKYRLNLLRDELISQIKVIDAGLEACRQEVAAERERLEEMERVVTPENKVLERQKSRVQKAESRLKKMIEMRNLYAKVNEFVSTAVVPNNIQLPGAEEMARDLQQQIGLDLSPGTHKSPEDEEERKVLVVNAVRPDSPAARAGLQKSDLIVGAHIWQITSPENLWYALSQVGSSRSDSSSEDIKVWVRRNGQFISVRLPPIKREG